YKKAKDEYAFNPASTANKNISSLFQVSSRYEYEVSARTALVGGVQFQHKQISSNDRGNHKLDQFAGFLILQQYIGKQFFLSPAVRVDHTENSGTELVPQINFSYKRKVIQLRGSAGKTIRQADFTERYNNYNKALVTSGSIGNPALAAERSFSYEAGIDIFIRNSLKLSSGFFRRDQSKLIDWVTTPYAAMPRKENLSPAGTYALATNIASVNTSGFETDIQFQRSFKQHQLIATAGLLWLDSKSTRGLQSFYISSHAKFLVNANMMYSNRFFAIGVNGLYKSRNEQSAPAIQAAISKDYVVCNIKAEGFLFAKKLSFFVQANNLFNRQYSDLLGSRMPGRWVMVGFSIQRSWF
ncbi:MAG: TonB-dependent receptor plug domain-containing protein, partial [Ferruginibacter sp.]